MADNMSPIKRQEHGIKAQTISITLPRHQAERLRRDAGAEGISISRSIVNLIELAWSIRDRLASVPADDERRAS